MPVSAENDGPESDRVAGKVVKFLYQRDAWAWSAPELSEELGVARESLQTPLIKLWRAGVLRRFQHEDERGYRLLHYTWDSDLTADDVLEAMPLAEPEYEGYDEWAKGFHERLSKRNNGNA